MSYQTWHDYGYGICVSDLKEEIELDRLMKLIQMAPKLHMQVEEFIDCDEQPVETYDILTTYVEEWSDIGYGGLATILHDVIKETEGIDLLVSTDFDGNEYLIYPPIYPWTLANLSDSEKNLTEKDLVELYSKYLHIVTDENLKVDYYSVANGG